jgi:hypothetical protein
MADRADPNAHIGERLAATAERIAALRTELEDECESRDRLIVEALDLGWERAQVARWSKMSPTRVGQITIDRTSIAV